MKRKVVISLMLLCLFTLMSCKGTEKGEDYLLLAFMPLMKMVKW